MMPRGLCALGLVMASCWSLSVDASKPVVPPGVLAMSAGDQVVLIDPGMSEVRTVETGPVGFLFPAPAAILFAPDVVNGRTTVIDLRSGRVVELMSGVTMPHFGRWPDRYLVVAGALTMVSFPERSLIFKLKGDFDRPWQVELGPEETTVLILERVPSGEGGSRISAVDLINRRIVFSKEFDHDLIRFAMAPGSGLMAVVDQTTGEVVLLDSKTLREMQRLAIPDGATDVVVLREGRELVVSGASGRLLRWKVKGKEGVLEVESVDPILFEGRALRLAVGPEGRLVAAATAQGRLFIVDSKKGRIVGQWETPPVFRDLQWVDIQKQGPLLPSWSDRGMGPEGANIGEK